MKIHETPAPDTAKSGNVRLIQNDFNAVVWLKGYDIYLDRTIKCPCSSQGSNSPLPSCMNCGGCGWTVIKRIKTKALIQSMNRDTKFKDWSEEDMGTASITLMQGERASYMDRVSILNSSYVMKEILYPKCYNGVYFDFATYDIEDILECTLFVDNQTPLLRLVKGTDYTISGSKFILNSNLVPAPTLKDPGPSVSILYEAKSQYLILDSSRNEMTSPTQDSNKTFFEGKFPLSYTGRRTHFVIDKPNFEGTDILDNTQD